MKLWASPAVLTFAIVLAVSAVMRSQAQAPPQLPAQPADVDQLFAKIYPVFAHDRCANCHGKVQHYPGIIRSVTTGTHPGGNVYFDPTKPPTGVECDDCHNATAEIRAEWQFTAPESMEWAGKNQEQVCVIEANQVVAMNARAGGAEKTRQGSYLNHLNTDALIEQAWHGRAGGARDEDDHPSPQDDLPYPPLERQKFLDAAEDWVNAGAPCRSTGSITQVETFGSHYEFPKPGLKDGKTIVQETARREINLLRNPDGTIEAGIVGDGNQTMITTYHDVGLNGPCTVTITTNKQWTRIGPSTVPAGLKITVEKDHYEVLFVVPVDPAVAPPPPLTPQGLTERLFGSGPPTSPPDRRTLVERLTDLDSGPLADSIAAARDAKGDKVRETGNQQLVNDCGIPNRNDVDDPIETEWPPWEFTIRCPKPGGTEGQVECDVEEPQKRGSVTGAKIVEVRQGDGADPQSWLEVSPVGNNRADTGEPLPITVTTRWRLSLRPSGP